jgi:hypothetical protein
VLVAREVRVPGSRDADAYDSASPGSVDRGWGKYDDKIRSHRK